MYFCDLVCFYLRLILNNKYLFFNKLYHKKVTLIFMTFFKASLFKLPSMGCKWFIRLDPEDLNRPWHSLKMNDRHKFKPLSPDI